jgi:hypothetical protein
VNVSVPLKFAAGAYEKEPSETRVSAPLDVPLDCTAVRAKKSESFERTPGAFR